MSINRQANPLLGLTKKQLETLLDEAFLHFRALGTVPRKYGLSSHFYMLAQKAASTDADVRELLKSPEVYLVDADGQLHVYHDYQSRQAIVEKFFFLKSTLHGAEGSDDFLLDFFKHFDWVENQKVRAVDYVCGQQEEYLRTNDITSLNPLTKRDISDNLGLHPSTVSRLTRNLAVELPSKTSILVDELIPGRRTLGYRIMYALGGLSASEELFENGQWKVSDDKVRMHVDAVVGFPTLKRRKISDYSRKAQRIYAETHS